MENDFLNIRTILDIEKWQSIQDQLSQVTGVAILLVDYKGIPVTEHSGCSDFCRMLRNDTRLSKNCHKCDSRGGFESARINDIFIYRCYCDIVDAAIPIVIGDIYVGAVMAGQMLIVEDEPKEYMEKIYTITENLPLDSDLMDSYYNKLPKFTYQQVNSIVKMIWSISNYIVEEAIKKYNLYEENLILKRKDEEYEKRINSKYDTTPHPNSSNSSNNSKTNPIINSAITYIDNNIDKNLTLNDLSELCYVSASYFSKVFYKEIGENFTNYIANLRVSRAKMLLKETNKTIQEITYELGFNDTSYFIRQFRKHEGTTPGNFRRLCKRDTIEYKIVTKG